MPHISKTPWQIGVAVSQLFSVLTGGWADETFSSRCWRLRATKGWNRARRVVDALFFWEKDHCRESYKYEVDRRHVPPVIRATNDK